MNVEEAVREAEESSNAWISTAILAALSLLLVWFGIYPNLLVTIIQSISNTIR